MSLGKKGQAGTRSSLCSVANISNGVIAMNDVIFRLCPKAVNIPSGFHFRYNETYMYSAQSNAVLICLLLSSDLTCHST